MPNKYSLFTLRIWEVVWCVLICVVGCIGNIFVIVVTRKSKSVAQTSPFNIYVMALAFADLIISLFAIPDYVLRTNIYELPSGYAGTILCKIVIGGFIPFTMLGISLYLLVAICFERRKAILTPFSTLQYKPVRVTVSYMVLIVFLSVFNQLPTSYGIYYNKENSTSGNFCAYQTNRILALVFHFLSFLFGCMIPAIIFLVSFYQINKQLNSVEKELKTTYSQHASTSSSSSKQQNAVLEKKRSTISTMRIVVIVFFFCIIPNEIVYMLSEFVPYAFLEMNSPLFQVTVLMRYSNSCLNPILYSFTSKEFRKHFVEVFPCIRIWTRESKKKVTTTRVKRNASNSKNYSLLL